MVPTPVSRSRHELEVGLIRAAVVAAVILAVILAGVVVFGWTLPAAPSFDLATNPGVDLP
jgi:hypothetical protein